MRTSSKKFIKAVLIPPIIFLIFIYFLLAWYYRSTFSYGTWINGVYCTGKTIEEINEELIQNSQVESITLLLQDGKSEMLELDHISYTIDYYELLETYQDLQNPLLWIQNVFNVDGVRLQPLTTFSEELLIEELETYAFYEEQIDMDVHEIRIIKSESGYVLEDTRAKVLDFELLQEEIKRTIISGKRSVNLYDSDIYYEIPMTIKDLETLALWELVEYAQDFSMLYLFGKEEEHIDASIVSEWIMVNEEGDFVFDEQGSLVIDEMKIEEYISTLSEKYNTYIFPRDYLTYDGRVVSVSKGNYGNLFDVEEEIVYLTNAYYDRNEASREPEYVYDALYQGDDDIGPDFIEIDLSNQKLYLVRNGLLEIETDVVTGNVAAGMKTTDRICYIYTMQTNRILRGPGYASHVDYWMPVYGGIGIHDADWRSSFGENIYLKNGSHGCINVPEETMPSIYEQSFVGMPVILYY